MAIIQKRAQYAGACRKCHGVIRPGELIWWSTQDRKSSHARCPDTEAWEKRGGDAKNNDAD